MFDAYTIKKVLPRLVIGVILIQLSWFLLTGFIQFVNALAFGLEAIIYAPFGGPDQMGSIADMFSRLPGFNGSAGGLFMGVAAATGAGLALGIPGILSLALTAFVSLLIGFAVLVLRQVVLLALLLISPLAFVAWILPGTEKLWKLWWESFSKLLLMFPMVVGLVAAGRVFAQVASVSGAGGTAQGPLGGVVDIFIIVLGIFGPFFLIPKTFQLAGSAFANLTGMFNDRSRGFFDKQREKRAGQVAKNTADWKAGDRFSGNNIAARAINRSGANVAAGWKGRYGMGKSGEAARARIAQVAAANNMKENQALNQMALNDDHATAIMAFSGGTRKGAVDASHDLKRSWVAGGMSEEAAEARRVQALAAAGAVGFNRQNAEAAMTLGAQNKFRSVGAGDLATLQRGINRLHGEDGGNNAQAAEGLRGTAEYHARQAGRFDLGGDTALAGGEKASLYQLANSQPQTITAMAESHRARVSGAAQAAAAAEAQHGTGSAQHLAAVGEHTKAKHEAAVFAKELKAMSPNSTGSVKKEIDKQLGAISGDPDIAGYMSTKTGNRRTGRVNYNPNDPAQVAGWDPVEKARGWRTEEFDETYGDVAEKAARTYQRPDENEL